MRATRSSTRTAAGNGNATGSVIPQTQAQSAELIQVIEKPKNNTRKRKADPDVKEDTKFKKIAVRNNPAHDQMGDPALPMAISSISQQTSIEPEDDLVPPVLTFDFEEAKKHLVQVDHRFEDIFSKLKCKPFEHLEPVQPFQTLVTSILGQQVSWQAARSITHKFRRLFDPSLPEKPDDEENKFKNSFPTPQQVVAADGATLRTAGLSVRKVEYVQDLAARFADGRLSTSKLLKATDEELGEMLIEVRGIGRWTVDMFAIFSLRRPDILPVADLGVQRGVLRWFLSLHSDKHSYSISPEKVAGGTGAAKSKKVRDDDELPSLVGSSEQIDDTQPSNETGSDEMVSLPPTFTPSIRKVLDQPAVAPGIAPSPLPVGIDVALLKSRLDGKKKIKGAFLTPHEMSALTESWKPYRSLGVYYMWSLSQ